MFKVEIVDWSAPHCPSSFKRARRRNFSDLAHARHYATKAAQRFVAKHGGTVRQDNWGTQGGHFARCYRTATIYLT